MSLRSIFYGLAFTATVSHAGLARADDTQSACFATHTPVRALPYTINRWAGQGSYEVLAGARVFFWAEPGLTKEWLHYQLARRVAERHATNSCPLDVSGVKIAVVSSGPGFWLEISAPDTSDARRVLSRAQALIPQ